MNCLTSEPSCKLFTPGPVKIPNRVMAASSYVQYHHRTPEFSKILLDTLNGLRPLFGTDQQVYPVHTTGRGALEGVYANILSAEDKAVSICNGSFGKMSADIISKMGISCVRCFESWTDQVDLAELEQIIEREHPTAVTVVHNDTSNGTVNPIAAIGALARRYGFLLLVDAVSSIGCMPFLFDDWGVDAVVTASQKGLMSPPGVSFAVLSPCSWEKIKNNSSLASYINFINIRKSIQTTGETPGTTPVSLILAVNEAVHMITEEGVEQVFKRHRALSLATKQALLAIGLSLFPEKCDARSDSLTIASVPDCVDTNNLVEHLRKKYHILIGKGLGDYARSSIRIAHMGAYQVEDMMLCIAALEASMLDLGYVSSIGVGVDSFLQKYNSAQQC